MIHHGLDAEAIVRTGGLSWIVSLTSTAVEQLELSIGSQVQLIVKSRSCQVSAIGATAEASQAECL